MSCVESVSLNHSLFYNAVKSRIKTFGDGRYTCRLLVQLSPLFSEDIQEDDVDPEDHQPFPTLKRVFEGVDRHTGFNIEVKFPQVKIVCSFLIV